MMTDDGAGKDEKILVEEMGGLDGGGKIVMKGDGRER